MKTAIDEAAIEAIVRAVRARLEQSVSENTVTNAVADASCGGETGHACTADPRPLHAIDNPVYEAMLPRLVALTSSQIAVGRCGARFRTDLYIRTREGHADARDAVHSEVDEQWPRAHQLLSLKTRCRDRHEYLLYPNLGRRLDDDSVAALQSSRVSAPDVQLIVGDGLSPNAITINGSQTLEALREALASAGLRTGPGLYVKFARIGVADQIGVMVGARATVMLVGERPGLGTGDSLSLYLAINPKLDQDNAEKNCISNVRPIGIAPHEAAAQTVTILQRGFERGVGGVALGVGWGRQ
jgi:ethanolamine ammonia-lyase small subunit